MDIRHDYIRRGRVSRWDMRRRALLRVWNDEDTWIRVGDKLAAWGCWGVILLAAVLIAAGVLRLGA